MNKKEKLLKAILEDSKEHQSFTITLINQNMSHPEKISWNTMDSKYKAHTIDARYDDNLVNVFAPFIQIVGWDSH